MWFLSVGMTVGNAKAIDLFAEKGTKTVNVQVKAIRLKRYGGWPMMKDKVSPNVIYVLVCLNEPETPPLYFVLTSAETRRKVKQYSTRGVINLSLVKSPEYQGRWDKIAKALR